MRVVLKALQKNSLRDFTVDPVDPDRVEELRKSIREDGFWGGVVGRRTKNGVQIIAGQHRIDAAYASGLREADIFVGEFDDADAIRIYANENALQRGNSGTALAGSVAAAVRYLAKMILSGVVSGEITRNTLEKARGNITTDKGIGRDLVLQVLKNVAGVTENVVKQQLENIKSSGNYGRIIREVQEQIEEENREALAELKRQEDRQRKAAEEQERAEAQARAAEQRRKEAAAEARTAKEAADKKRAEAEAERAELARQKAEAEAKLAEKRRKELEAEGKQFAQLKQTRDTASKAADVAEDREKTFDYEGVAAVLKNASHVDTFRHLATGKGAVDYLPVTAQAGVARKLIALAKSTGSELTSNFIRMNFMDQLVGAKQAERKLDAEDKAKIARKSWSDKAGILQHDAARGAGLFLSATQKFAAHAKHRPDGVVLHITGEFKLALQNVKRAVALIEKAMS